MRPSTRWPRPRCLTLLTHRPTFIPSWRPCPQLLQLTLGPLNPEQVECMVTDLAGDADLPTNSAGTLSHRPMASHCLWRNLPKPCSKPVGRYSGPTFPRPCPTHCSARLDGVGRAKETAQWAAVLGREFAYPVLAAAVPYGEQRLQDDLALLVEADLVHRSSDVSQGSYAFKHVLIQEAAYASLLRRTRRDPSSPHRGNLRGALPPDRRRRSPNSWRSTTARPGCPPRPQITGCRPVSAPTPRGPRWKPRSSSSAP